MPLQLTLRVDARPEVGAGHLMRSLALAQAWQLAEGEATFLVEEGTPPFVLRRLASEGMDVHQLHERRGSTEDAAATAAHAIETGASWLVADGYQFDAKYQRIIKEHEVRLLLVDDYGHADRYFADVILNQNLGAAEAWYARRPARSRLLLGTRYALLRKEFFRWHDWRRGIPEVANQVVVTLGMTDPHDVTLMVLHALGMLDVDGLNTTMVVGGLSPSRKAVEFAVRNARGVNLVVDPPDMADLMARADVAVAAGGSTSWELAFMGLPAVTIILADNQRGIAEALEGAGAGVNMGWHADLTPEALAMELKGLLTDPQRRESMSRAGKTLVDGRGADRVVEMLQADRPEG